MSLDPRSIARLNSLIAKESSSTKAPQASSRKKSPENNKLHPIETEDNPKKLFHELMKASPNGEVPQHLLDRLKQLESINSKEAQEAITESTHLDSVNPKSPSRKLSNLEIQEQSLYTAFDRLLLEEE